MTDIEFLATTIAILIAIILLLRRMRRLLRRMRRKTVFLIQYDGDIFISRVKNFDQNMVANFRGFTGGIIILLPGGKVRGNTLCKSWEPRTGFSKKELEQFNLEAAGND